MNRLKSCFLGLYSVFLVLSTAMSEEVPVLPAQPLFTPPVQEVPLPVDQQSQDIELRIENNSVYLKSRNANLKELLIKLGNLAGIEVSAGSLSNTISISIEGLSVEETVHRIMNMVQERNYNIYYNEDGSIKRLEVFTSAETPSSIQQQGPQRPVIPRYRRPPIPQPPQTGQGMQEIQPPAQIIPQDEDQ